MPNNVVIKVPSMELMQGNDGFSPVFEQEDIGTGYKVKVTDAVGPHEFTLLHGKQGPQGAQGIPGNYTKPASGIPASDLASDVQTSLGKANTAKKTQTAVSDPTASGTSATFIATISQNAQGVITPTKKTVRSATASQSGLMSGNDKAKLDGLAPFYVRPNLLDNWYFVGGGSQLGDGVFPVNQRGDTIYTGAVYGIDRWYSTVAMNSLNILSDGINVISGSSQSAIQQDLANPNKLAGKTISVSALSDDGLLEMTVNIPNPLPSAAETVTSRLGNSRIVIGYGAGGIKIYLATNGSNKTAHYAAAKIEIGDTQTLAHQENGVWVLNELPDYGEELAKCQRYFQEIKVGNGGLLGIAFAANATTAYCSIPIAQPMFGSKALEGTAGGFELYSPQGTKSVSASSIVNTSTAAINVMVTSSELTPGGVYYLRATSEGAAIKVST